MTLSVRSGLASGVAAAALVPGVAAAQSVDPFGVTTVSVATRVVGSFLLVSLFGGALVVLADDAVEAAVDASMAAPLKSLAYGLLAPVMVLFFGFYGVLQLAQVSGVAADLALVAIGVALFLLSGLGFTVVGARLTELVGERRLWPGVAAGAALSAALWLLPWFALALLCWILVTAVGVGGPTAAWLNASRSVTVEPDA